ncbi:MAG: malto-oligosyltrehalose synthase [Cellulomonadaceae bacterium]
MSQPADPRVPRRRLPGPGRVTPCSTYRLQLGADLTFDDVVARLGYYVSLGVSHLYLSPVLEAAPGSTHGYDVVDHTRISAVMGGREGLERLATAAHEVGLGLILDIVPNHMAVPTPAWHNRALWSVLAHGPDSPYADWFDVDWSSGEGSLLMPVLGARIGDVLAAGELSVAQIEVPSQDGSATLQTVLRYYDHVFPVRVGTESLPLGELVERQHYRLAYWRVGDEELNYRRFFDVGTLVAIRVERPEVFDATHALVLELFDAGVIDGLRVDHPDGLADPAGYLERLAERTGNAWVAVEKILAGDEQVPAEWETVGTTGYEGLWRLQTCFTDTTGMPALADVLHDLTGDGAASFPAIVETAKREIVTGPLYAEVHRLTDLAADICRDDLRLRDHTWRALNDCLRELLIAFDRYRAYARPGHETHPSSVTAMAEAVVRARRRLGADRAATLDVVVDLLLGREAGSAGRTREARRDELVVRFQQVCGAVMAKGVEDTAFYRWTLLTSLCEVGGEPDQTVFPPPELHAFAAHFQVATPVAMTTGSTHDTKRGEDTRARIGVLSEYAADWNQAVRRLSRSARPYRSARVDGRIENLLWQTLVGTWDETAEDPMVSADRLTRYLTKAMRESKTATSWTAPDERYETAVLDMARAALVDLEVRDELSVWATRTAEAVRVASLGVKAVQLTFPGVADVYQGSESWRPTLVDPDNRGPVDPEPLAAALAHLDSGGRPRTLGEEKLLVTSRALRLRRDLRDAFVGPGAGYAPLPTTSGHLLAFTRTEDGAPRAVTLATRLHARLQENGGWGAHTVVLPDGQWHDVLTDRELSGGAAQLAELFDRYPVVLLAGAHA